MERPTDEIWRALAFAGAAVLLIKIATTPWSQLTQTLVPLGIIAAVAQGIFAFVALQSLAHARTSATAATDAAQVMKDSAEKQLRAYVAIDTVKMLALTPGALIRTTCEMRNVGATPAMNAVPIGTLRYIQGEPASAVCDPMETEGDGRSGVEVMSTRHKLVYPVSESPITEDEISEFRAGRGAIYMYGRVEYTDVFGKSRLTAYSFYLHTTEVTQSGGYDCGLTRDGNYFT